MGFSCKISLSVVQIWWSSYYSSNSSQLFIGYLLKDFSSSHPNLVITFLFSNYSVSQLSQIVVFGIDTRQGCKLFKVVPPHLILVAWICVCIIIGSLDWVIEALKQIDWFYIKFKSTVYWLSLARFLFPSSKFGHRISVWQL